MSGVDNDDIIEILKAYPQTQGLARFERATGVLHLGVRALLNNPRAAREALTAQELQTFGGAVTARGQNLVAIGENLTAMGKEKAAAPSGPDTACSGPYNTETDQ